MDFVQLELAADVADYDPHGFDQDAAGYGLHVNDRSGQPRDAGVRSREDLARELDDLRQYACSSR